MNRMAQYVKFKAQPGKGGELASILLEAAEQSLGDEGCQLYIVNAAAEDPDTIWVTELWSDADAHQASLRNPAAQAMIQRAMPLIAGAEPVKLRPLGGKGF